MEVGEEGDYIPIATLSPPECIKMGSDERRFNVSVGSDGHKTVTRQCPQTTTFLKRKESRSGIDPRSFRLPARPALPLGQTGSPAPPPTPPTPLHVYIYIINNSNMVGVFRYELGNTNKEEEKSIFTGAQGRKGVGKVMHTKLLR